MYNVRQLRLCQNSGMLPKRSDLSHFWDLGHTLFGRTHMANITNLQLEIPIC